MNAVIAGSVLCLDLGTTTGWALIDRDQQILSGSQSFHPSRYEGAGMRFLKFKRWLSEVSSDDLSLVLFEEVRRHLGTDAAHVYGGFMALLQTWCELRSIPYCGIPVGTIKKHVTGSGNAGKLKVIDAVRALGFEPRDDNEADAIALARFAIAEYMA